GRRAQALCSRSAGRQVPRRGALLRHEARRAGRAREAAGPAPALGARVQVTAAVMPERSGRWSLETLELADPGPREVVVRVVASGICQTDVHARDGFFPLPWPAVYG